MTRIKNHWVNKPFLIARKYKKSYNTLLEGIRKWVLPATCYSNLYECEYCQGIVLPSIYILDAAMILIEKQII